MWGQHFDTNVEGKIRVRATQFKSCDFISGAYQDRSCLTTMETPLYSFLKHLLKKSFQNIINFLFKNQVMEQSESSSMQCSVIKQLAQYTLDAHTLTPLLILCLQHAYFTISGILENYPMSVYVDKPLGRAAAQYPAYPIP